ARSWLGRTPPDIEVQLLGGKRFQLSDQIGRRPILVSFFATWCQPCKEELKELKHFAKRHPDSRLMVLLIDADEKRDLVRAYLSKEAVPFPAGIDIGGAIGKRYRISAVPTSVFIGLDGRISLYQQGAILNADVVLAPLLEQQQGMLRRHQQISKAEYLRRLAAEEKFHPRVKNRSGIVLTEAQKAFAQKLICPVENVPVLEGKCPVCKALRRKLAKIKVEGLTDTQIFQKLYMKNEGGNRAQSR
ncbi:MAG: redoxin domain-containing protein, partial [Acidobacteriota bacterium]